jgi:tetratricopeptide (TPR) repeat protein
MADQRGRTPMSMDRRVNPRPSARPDTPRRAAAALACLLLAACGSVRRAPDAFFERAYPLTGEELDLSPEEALAAARELIAARESEGALDHAVALLHYHRPQDPTSPEFDALLAEAHARIADACDLGVKAEAAHQRSHWTAGLDFARDAVRQDAQDGRAQYWLGRLLLCAAEGERSYGRLQEALRAIETADRLAPACDDAGPARYLGRIYQETPGWPFLGSIPKAIAHYERAVKLAPDNLQNRLWLGEAYAAARQPEKARAEWTRVLAAGPRAGRAREDEGLKARARARLGKLAAK